MSFKLYNTLKNRKELFTPLQEGRVGLYVCGITVYDICHVGHARSAVVFDVLRRYLEYRGYEVTYVKNYTDVDDKIIARANAEGVSITEIADRYIAAHDADMAGLGVLPADGYPPGDGTHRRNDQAHFAASGSRPGLCCGWQRLLCRGAVFGL